MTKLSKLLTVLSVVSVTSTAYYLLFVLTYNPVHFFYPPVDETLINPWLRSHLPPLEGIEVYYMFFSLLVFIPLGYFLIRKFEAGRVLVNRLVQAVMILPFIALVLRTRSDIFNFSSDLKLDLIILISVGTFLYLSWRYFEVSSRLVFILLWLVFASVVFLSMDKAAEFSYSFTIGPALKLSQGETLGTFPIYYGLPITYLFKAMTDLRLDFSQIQLVFGAIFVFWFFLYYQLAKKMIRDKFLVFLFMAALVAYRFFAIRHDPTAFSELSPLRLEVWVPLLIVTWRFGLTSIVTSSAFALAYVFDSFFGFLYLTVYVVIVVYVLTVAKYAPIGPKNATDEIKKFWFLAIAPVLAAVFQLLVFGSLISTVGQKYQSLRLYFMPISNRSVFWVIVPIFLFFFYLVSREKDRVRKNLMLLTLGLALVQMLYFYGSSWDHNLLNISGTTVLLLFLCFDYLRKYLASKVVYVIAAIFILFGSIAFTRYTLHKLDQVRVHLANRQYVTTHPVDFAIDNQPDLFGNDKKIFLLSTLDSYFNYRYGLKQVGFNTPYYSSLYVEDTVRFLADLKNQGYRLILWEPVILDSLADFNQSEYLKSQNLQFSAKDRGDYLEVDLVKPPSSLIVTSGWKNYSLEGISFEYPPNWQVDNNSGGVILADNLDRFFIFIDGSQDNLGTLIDQGPAQIPNFDRAQVKVYIDRGVQKLLFSLFRGKSRIQVLVYPADSDKQSFSSNKMIQFDNFLRSIKIDRR